MFPHLASLHCRLSLSFMTNFSLPSLSSNCLFLEAILSASFFPSLPVFTFFSFMAFTIGFSLSSGSLVRFLKGLGSGTPGKPSRFAKHLGDVLDGSQMTNDVSFQIEKR